MYDSSFFAEGAFFRLRLAAMLPDMNGAERLRFLLHNR